MTVKVMKGTRKGHLHKTVSISAHGSETIYFNSSGTYFTKTMAVAQGRDPIYKKGKFFSVTNDDTGYSILTLTFTIRESAIPQSSGQTISKSEFDLN